MAFTPPQLDFASKTYLTLYLSPASPYLSDPSSTSTIHPALTHVGPVGVMRDVQIVSVSKAEWQHVSDEVLASLRDKAGIASVEVQSDPKVRAKKATIPE